MSIRVRALLGFTAGEQVGWCHLGVMGVWCHLGVMGVWCHLGVMGVWCHLGVMGVWCHLGVMGVGCHLGVMGVGCHLGVMGCGVTWASWGRGVTHHAVVQVHAGRHGTSECSSASAVRAYTATLASTSLVSSRSTLTPGRQSRLRWDGRSVGCVGVGGGGSET